MHLFSPLFAHRRLSVGLALVAVCAALAGCQKRSAAADQPGWYLEKTGDATAQLMHVDAKRQRQVWAGVLADDSPRSSGLTPLRPGEDKGLFRWSRTGCAELSFVLTRDNLKCATCMQPVKLVPDSGTCDFDQQRLPVEGWTAIRLPLPR